MKDYCKQKKVPIESVAFVGNDINDLDAMEMAGYAFCPSDAHKSIKKISDHSFQAKGGCGVIRELFEYLTNE